MNDSQSLLRAADRAREERELLAERAIWRDDLGLSPREIAAFDLTNALAAAADGGLRHGLEAEILRDATARSGCVFDPSAFVVPWPLLARRDMTASDTGWPLVGVRTAPAVDALRPFSAVLQAGATLLPGQTGNLTVPEVTSDPTAYWLADEISPVTATQPALGALTATPKTVAALVAYSMQLRRQATPGGLIERILLGTIGAALDRAVLQGSGVAGEPVGLNATPGVSVTVGTSLGWAGIAEMLENASVANGEPSAWIATPAVRGLLQRREKAAGSGLVWDNGTMAGLPAFATAACPTASLFTGPWADILLPIWGPGPILEIDPYTSFRSGGFRMRVLLRVDVLVAHRSAFAKSTGIT